MKDFVTEMKELEAKLIDRYFPLEQIASMKPDRDVLIHMRFPGTYILSDNEFIFYIGVSINIGGRLITHLTNKTPFRDHVSLIQIIRFTKWEHAEIMESVLINKIHPRYNKFIPGECMYLYDRFDKEEKDRVRSVVHELAKQFPDNKERPVVVTEPRQY